MYYHNLSNLFLQIKFKLSCTSVCSSLVYIFSYQNADANFLLSLPRKLSKCEMVLLLPEERHCFHYLTSLCSYQTDRKRLSMMPCHKITVV